MTPAKREALYRNLARAIPEPKSELEHTTPFELLVAVVLSAQATDKSVNLAVDTHGFRVSNRTRLAPGKDPLEVETKLLKVTPKKYLRNAHHYLILHGRYTCLAKKPLCARCPIFEQCEFPERKKIAKEEK